MNLLQQYQTHLQLQNIPGVESSNTPGMFPKRSDPDGSNGKVKFNKPNLFFKNNLPGNNPQKQSNQHHAESNLSQNYRVRQINHNFSNNFSVFTANNQLNITRNPSIVNTKGFFVTNIDPNQKTTKSEKTDAVTFNWAEENLINFNIS